MNKQLRDVRLKSGMSLETLSDLSGIAHNTIYGFEHDKYNTGFKNVMILAQTLGYEFVLVPITKERNHESDTSELYSGC